MSFLIFNQKDYFMLQPIHKLLELLRLHGMEHCLESVLSEAQQQGRAVEDVLLQLLEIEYQDRNDRALANRLKKAKMPWEWSIDTFPFKQQPSVKKSQIMSLAKLEFIKNFEN